jgi:hypothetical protein
MPHVSLNLVVEHLGTIINWEQISKADLESVCRFFINSGYHGYLTKHLAENAEIIPHFPWPYFVEALFKSTSEVHDQFKQSIVAGANESEGSEELSRTHELDSFDNSFIESRQKRRQRLKFQEIQIRTDLLQQIELLTLQGLHDQEEEALLKLLRFFPGDPDAVKMLDACREKKALDVLSRRFQHKGRPRPVEKKDLHEATLLDAIEESQKRQLVSWPYLAIDFAISHWMWDNPEAGIRFLDGEPTSPSRDWLRIDLLLKARRYVDAMEELHQIESRYSSDPDTILAAIYYRAQALWGLGEKFQAIEILESLCASQSDYRSASAILAEMREDLE